MEWNLDLLYEIIPIEAKTIDPDFLALVTIARSNRVNTDYIRYLESKYNMRDYETLEFLGDGILEALLKNTIYEQVGDQGPGVMNKALMKLRGNNFLACIAEKVGICRIVQTNKLVSTKICADVFEALLGALFLHLNSLGLNALNILQDWLETNWNLSSYIHDVVNNIYNPCLVADFKVQKLPVSKPVRSIGFQSAMTDLKTFTPEELEMIIDQSSDLLHGRELLQRWRQLAKFYHLGLSDPSYIQTPSSLGIYSFDIICPVQICPEGGILGRGSSTDKLKARNRTLEDALVNLTRMGYVIP